MQLDTTLAEAADEAAPVRLSRAAREALKRDTIVPDTGALDRVVHAMKFR